MYGEYSEIYCWIIMCILLIIKHLLMLGVSCILEEKKLIIVYRCFTLARNISILRNQVWFYADKL